MKAVITYDKETRIETYPFPRDGIREAVFNSLIHCNWADSIPIQIRIEDEAMYISNSCILPSDWTTETLMRRHKSRPHNPDIANVFFRAGYVETWGRGIQKICEACMQHGIPEPAYEVLGGDITVKFTALRTSKNPKPQRDVLEDVLEINMVGILKSDSNKKQKIIAEELGISVATVQRIMKRLVEQGKIERKGGKRFGYWEIHE